MLHKIYIIFYAKMSKPNADGLIPIYMRVTVSGQRFEISSQRSVRPEKWVRNLGKVKPDNEEARATNVHLDMLKKQVYDYETLLRKEGAEVILII